MNGEGNEYKQRDGKEWNAIKGVIKEEEGNCEKRQESAEEAAVERSLI